MRKSTLLLSSLALSTVVAFGQNSRVAGPIIAPSANPINAERSQELLDAAERTPSGHVRCFSTQYEQLQLEANPGMQTAEEFEAWMAEKLKTNAHNQSNKAVRTIPVVVHVLYGNATQNISMAQIQSQMDVMNDDFRRTNADASNTPAAFQGVAVDSEIEFCLASTDPNGQPTDGVNRVNTGSTSLSNTEIDNTWKPQTSWDPTKYFNIWVAPIGGGILGWAQFPDNSGLAGMPGSGGAANTDGVVIGYNYFGTTGTAQAPFNGGRTATHEVGHWLGLRHIWGDGACGTDDFCNDTPESDAANYGCSSTHQSCGSTDMVQNYMDYSNDACMNLFTADQKARMDVVLANSPRRNSLLTSNVCAAAAINADFSGTPLVINEGMSVSFTDASTSPDVLNSWSWSFPGADVTSHNGQTPPAITYSTAGTYDVSLTVGDNNGGSDTETKTMYVTVNPAGTAICDSMAAGWDWNTEQFGGGYWNVDLCAGAPNDGYIMGNNCYDDNGWAQRVAHPGANMELVEVRYVFVQSTGTGSGSLKIWDGDGAAGAPNTVLASAPITTGQFSANLNGFVQLTLPTPIDLDVNTNDLYIGNDHDVTPLDGDTLVMGIADATTNAIWAKETGGWIDLSAYGVSYKGTVMAVVCNKTTGVRSVAGDLSEVVAYPNPTTGTVEVMLPKNNATVVVYNMVGEQVLNSSTTSNMLTLDLANQPNGVYFIKVTSEGETVTKKVLLSK